MITFRRLAASLIAALLASGAVVLPATRVAAISSPKVMLKPGAKFERDYPGPLPGSFGPDFTLGLTPADCEDDGAFAQFCDAVHVHLDVPPANFTDRHFLYSFNVAISWAGENLIIPTFGNVSTTEYGMTIYDDPIVKDDDGATECDPEDPIINYYICFVAGPAGGGKPGGEEPYYPVGGVGAPYVATSPLQTGLIPKRNDFVILVFNYYGAPSPYTITLGLVEITSDTLKDLSIEDFADLSSDAGLAANTGGVGLTPSAGLGAAAGDLSGGFDLSPVGVTSDTDLTGQLDDKIPGLDRSAADIIKGRRIRALRPPGDEKPFLVVLWLVLLPIGLAGGAVWWFVRRRSSVFG
jgi:hypothetical protein